jgi:hypothetical protein
VVGEVFWLVREFDSAWTVLVVEDLQKISRTETRAELRLTLLRGQGIIV